MSSRTFVRLWRHVFGPRPWSRGDTLTLALLLGLAVVVWGLVLM